jgi:hypothetical protein
MTATWFEARELSPTRNLLATSKRQLDIIHLLRKICYQPDSSALRASQAELLLAEGETVEAARATRRAAELSQGDPNLYFRLARMYEISTFCDKTRQQNSAGSTKTRSSLTPSRHLTSIPRPAVRPESSGMMHLSRARSVERT